MSLRRRIEQFLLDSFWFAPGVIVVLWIVAALLLIELDEVVGTPDNGFIFSGSPTGARAVMATVAGSSLTIIGIAVPLTVVALQLAAAQFTQRILRNFMRDRVVQLFLGVFVGTFAYALLILRVIRSSDEAGASFVPYISVSIGVVLTLLSMALFVIFVSHIVNLLQVTNIIAMISKETGASIDGLFPSPVGSGKAVEWWTEPPEDSVPVQARTSGYLQAVELDAVFRLAGERYETVWIERRIGEFCAEGSIIFRLRKVDEADEDPGKRLHRLILLGRHRTTQGDTLFGFRQIADIASRALSPGVNDPTTAIQCLDYIEALMLRVSTRDLPSGVVVDEAGKTRLVMRLAPYEAYVSEAFDQIREFGEGNVAVTRRLVEALAHVLEGTENIERRGVLASQLRLTIAGARRSIKEPADLAALEVLAARLAQESLADADPQRVSPRPT